MQYVVPAKDKSFVEDMAKARGWEAVTTTPTMKPAKVDKAQGAGRKTQAAKQKAGSVLCACISKNKPSVTSRRLSGLEKAILEIERGEIFSAASVDDMVEQILGKGWRTK